MKKIVFTFFSVFVFFVSFIFVHAQANIQNSNSTANLEIDNTDVVFSCDGCEVEVSDTEIIGNIWGESLGWVNLQPSDGGVFNTRTGQVGGNAWGATSGWVDFSGVSINPLNGQFSGTAVSQNRGLITFECPGSSCVVTTWRPIGCTDFSAENYDNTAVNDDGSCVYLVEGCTDVIAQNYNPLAEKDDGSCTYPQPPEEDGGGSGNLPVEGCTDPTAENYDESAVVDDSSCVYCQGLECVDIYGCMDPLALNYDPDASLSSGNCSYPNGNGCTNPSAQNYNPQATANDGTCIFPEPPIDEPVQGCNDPQAINYNPNVTVGDTSCLYSIPGQGCTNPEAINYNANALMSDGSCIFVSDDGELVDEDGNPVSEDDIDNDNDPIVNDTPGDSQNQNGISSIIENLLNILPGALSNQMLQAHEFVVRESGLLALLTAALLAASLLQIIPIREGNLLLSLFGFYAMKKYWGTVYDSVTKQPLDPAYITLFDDAGQVVDTSITDIDGRYNFIVGPGTYYLSAQKTDYLFPSKKLEGKNYDELYAHLYFGGPVQITKNDEVLSLNIPMDPLNFNWNEYAKRETKVTHFYRPWHRVLSVASHILFVAGFLLALWVFAVDPTILSFIVVSLYILTVVLRSIGFRYIPRGYVRDLRGNALSYAIMRVYSAELHKEVRHAVVGPGGHYLLLVPNGKYYMTIDKKRVDGSYQKIHTTKTFKVHKGFIAKKLTIKTMVEEEAAFSTMFSPDTQNKNTA